jgi:hypothetical protein
MTHDSAAPQSVVDKSSKQSAGRLTHKARSTEHEANLSSGSWTRRQQRVARRPSSGEIAGGYLLAKSEVREHTQENTNVKRVSGIVVNPPRAWSKRREQAVRRQLTVPTYSINQSISQSMCTPSTPLMNSSGCFRMGVTARLNSSSSRQLAGAEVCSPAADNTGYTPTVTGVRTGPDSRALPVAGEDNARPLDSESSFVVVRADLRCGSCGDGEAINGALSCSAAAAAAAAEAAADGPGCDGGDESDRLVGVAANRHSAEES